MSEGIAIPAGHASFEILKRRSWVPEELDAELRAWKPRTHLGEVVRACTRYLPLGLAFELLDEMYPILVGEGWLHVGVFRNGENPAFEDWGVVSRKVVTDAAVARLISGMQGLTTIDSWNYHGLGTGANAESAADTGLQTELTTQYNPDNTRTTGVVTAPAANQYRTQATVAVDGAVTIQEHGVFTQAAAPGGTLLDRSLTGGQNLQPADGLIATYTFSLVSGG